MCGAIGKTLKEPIHEPHGGNSLISQYTDKFSHNFNCELLADILRQAPYANYSKRKQRSGNILIKQYLDKQEPASDEQEQKRSNSNGREYLG